MEAFPALLTICAGNSPVPGEFPAQRPVMQSFGVFFDLRLNKRLSNNREAGDMRRYRVYYDVIVMLPDGTKPFTWTNVDLSFIRSISICLRGITQYISQPSVSKIS